MSHIIRQQPDGLWCIYSTVVEEIVLYDAEKEDVIEYKLQKRREDLEEKLDEIEQYGSERPVTNHTKSFEDILDNSSLELDGDGKIVDPTGESEIVDL